MISKKERIAILTEDRRRLLELIGFFISISSTSTRAYETELANDTTLLDRIITNARALGRDYSSVIR